MALTVKIGSRSLSAIVCSILLDPNP
uniref:Uncharacterized protein n=1 Tax=Rhizophora mucronata TaxID=61149 RepID=A0A2P2Q7N2_RHIMU